MMNKSAQYQPDYAISPVETLNELIENRKANFRMFTQGELLASDILRGLKDGSLQMNEKIASALEKALNVPASFWMSLEKKYRETLAQLEAKI